MFLLILGSVLLLKVVMLQYATLAIKKLLVTQVNICMSICKKAKTAVIVVKQ